MEITYLKLSQWQEIVAALAHYLRTKDLKELAKRGIRKIKKCNFFDFPEIAASLAHYLRKKRGKEQVLKCYDVWRHSFLRAQFGHHLV